METLLSVLKVIGLLLSASFGLLGTIHEFRDKNGKLTKWGVASIGGIVASVMLAVGAQLVEDNLKQQSAQEAAAQSAESARRSETIVRELARVLQPLDIQSMFIGGIRIPLEDSRFDKLRKRFDADVERYLADWEAGRPVNRREWHIKSMLSVCREGASTVPWRNCSPGSVEISAKHPTFPRSDLEAAIFGVNNASLSFYRVPIDPKSLYRMAPNEADLTIQVGEWFGGAALDLRKRLDMDPPTYELMGLLEVPKRGPWKQDRTGRIASMPDLSGAQLIVSLGSLGWRIPRSLKLTELGLSKDTKTAPSEDVDAMRRKFELGTVSITIGARSLWINKGDWIKHTPDGRPPFWEYRFPIDPFAVKPR